VCADVSSSNVGSAPESSVSAGKAWSSSVQRIGGSSQQHDHSVYCQRALKMQDLKNKGLQNDGPNSGMKNAVGHFPVGCLILYFSSP